MRVCTPHYDDTWRTGAIRAEVCSTPHIDVFLDAKDNLGEMRLAHQLKMSVTEAFILAEQLRLVAIDAMEKCGFLDKEIKLLQKSVRL